MNVTTYLIGDKLLRRCGVTICSRSSSLSQCLFDDIGLVHCALDNLLLLGVEVLGKVLVERGLLLLEACFC